MPAALGFTDRHASGTSADVRPKLKRDSPERSRTGSAPSRFRTVCTEKLNPDVVAMKSAKDRV
jgi:hypothetical protein